MEKFIPCGSKNCYESTGNFTFNIERGFRPTNGTIFKLCKTHL